MRVRLLPISLSVHRTRPFVGSAGLNRCDNENAAGWWRELCRTVRLLPLRYGVRPNGSAQYALDARLNMNEDIREIISKIEGFEPTDEGWLELDALIQRLLASEHPERGIDALLGVLERFPEEDGYGVFWSILHALESLPGYQNKLIESVIRSPSEMTITMINRMLNSGLTEVDGTNLLKLMENVATNQNYSASIREEAKGYIEWQNSRI